LNLPYSDDALLAALLPFERVFSLNSPIGAPGELSLNTGYYRGALWSTGRARRSSRGVDESATRMAEVLDRLALFQRLAEAPGAGEPA
jgi:hypothetical protein